MLDRERQRQDVLRGEELAEVLGELCRPVDLRGPWRDTLVGEDPDRVAKVALRLGEAIGRRPARLG